MIIYFILIRIAAFFGHRKAQLLVEGQKQWQEECLHSPSHDSRQHWIWFHVASVGEFEQARPIIERLKSGKEDVHILLTFFSPSGYELRKHYDKADKVMYLPFATRRNARAFLDRFQPKKAIFIKYEFWPAYLHALHERHIPTYLVSGIFRKSQLFFRPWGITYRQLLKDFTHLYVQDEASRTLLERYDITNVTVAGDTRFDRVIHVAAEDKAITPVEHFTHGQERVIVAGSTWPEDEVLLARYMQERPDVRLVIAPHEINTEHMQTIFQLFEGRFVRYSEANNKNLAHTRILVIDTIGLLSHIYRYGQVAYIGGGFGAGIHNTIEAAVYGVPVLFGPKYTHFREAVSLIEAGGGCSVHDYTSFRDAMDDMLERHVELGIRSKAYVASELGATDRVMSLFKK